MSVDRNAPLGVFDSGLGGLTVVRALRQVLPAERIVYLGDTARVPYGTKAPTTVVKYALACARRLVENGVKSLVVACNTVSAVAPEQLRIELDIPVLGVIDPGARAAVAASKTGRIGVLATTGTIASGAYPRAVAKISTRAEVVGQAAPLLVPLAEEGWTEGEVPRLAVRRYIEPFTRAGVDVIVLGCTHYPLLRRVIDEEVRSSIGPHVVVVDSAQSTASDVRAFLQARGLARPEDHARDEAVRMLVTDVPRTFRETATRFLGADFGEVEQVDL
ncbi:MAG: glutamate racemase [Myxococcota bacterium]|nr:glutamate racemase [Myxococcota bacterium]